MRKGITELEGNAILLHDESMVDDIPGENRKFLCRELAPVKGNEYDLQMIEMMQK